jgi:curved DNA-binding protein CbpA
MINRTNSAYSTLGIQPGASLREARAAYHTLAKVTHPDHGGSAEAFRQVQSAYVRIRPSCSAGIRPDRIDVYA